MRILGLTGDIACGKSTVASMLRRRGAQTLDSDLLVHELYGEPQFAAQVQGLFKKSILNSDGVIDRKLLGSEVFGQPEALKRLESLVFPAVGRLRENKLSEFTTIGQKIVVIEAVKLLESGQGTACEEIWSVVCAPPVQLKRLMQNRGLTEGEARARLQSQPSREAKLELAGATPLVWIENDGTLEELENLVERQWKLFLA